MPFFCVVENADRLIMHAAVASLPPPPCRRLSLSLLCYYQHCYQALYGAVSGLVHADSGAARAILDALDPYHSLSWVRETAHFVHQRIALDEMVLPAGDGATVDRVVTPAGLLHRALIVYDQRPALGIPDDELVASLPVDVPSVLCRSPLAAAAGLAMTRHRGYKWLNFQQVALLASGIARGLTLLQRDVTTTTAAAAGVSDGAPAAADEYVGEPVCTQ